MSDIFMNKEDLYGKSIVIYGGSVTGQNIYHILKDTCDVLAVLDSNKESIAVDSERPVLDPKEYNYGDSYYIIASSNLNSQSSIRAFLMNEKKIDYDKILVPSIGFMITQDTDILTFEYEISHAADYAWRVLLRVRDRYRENFAIMDKLLRFYNNYPIDDKVRYIKLIRDEFYHTDEVAMRIMCAQYLFDLNELTPSEMKRFVEDVTVFADDHPEWAYCLAKNIALFELRNRHILYDTLGQDRRKLWRKLSDHYLGNYSLINENKAGDRVLLLVPDLCGENHSPAIVYRNFANFMCRMGKDIKILVVLNVIEKSYDFLSMSYYGTSTVKNKSYNRNVIDSKVSIEYIEMPDIGKMLQAVIDCVNEYQPYYVVDGMDDLCPVSNVLVEKYPVYYLAIRTCTCGVDFTKTDMPLFDYNQEIADKKFVMPIHKGSFERNKNIHYSKQDFNIPDHGFLVITVGRRLHNELGDDLIEEMNRLLEADPDIYWMLVGDDTVRHRLETISAYDHIRILPYEQYLTNLYDICDVFLNPDRMGGGFSIRMAMQEGVVIDALKKNGLGGAEYLDAEELIDGGAKEQVSYIGELYHNRLLLCEKKQLMTRLNAGGVTQWEWYSILNEKLNDMAEEYYSKITKDSFECV